MHSTHSTKHFSLIIKKKKKDKNKNKNSDLMARVTAFYSFTVSDDLHDLYDYDEYKIIIIE